MTEEDRAIVEAAQARIAERRRTFRNERDEEPAPRRLPVVDEPLAPVDFQILLARMKSSAEARNAQILTDDCPVCDGPGCAKARECRASGNDWCKWTDQIAALAADEATTDDRLRRLQYAGIRHRVVLDTFPTLRTPPLPVGAKPELARLVRAPMDAAVEYLRNRQILNLTLAGSAGTGKTWAAAWIVADSNYAKWVGFSSISPNDDWSALRRTALNAPLVVVNDLGAGPLVGWRDAEVEALIVERDDATLRTVVTTNLTLDAVRTRFGDRLHGRLTGRSSRVVECIGPDLRKA